MKNYVYQLMTDQRKDVVACFFQLGLWFLSIFYRFTVDCVNFAYKNGLLKNYSLAKPVISIGNITVGGVGKTPLIIYIAQYLKQKGIKPVILTRGYMNQRFLSKNDKNFSDEAAVIQKNLTDVPVLVGADRLKNAQSLSSDTDVDVFLLDDGFQHRKIRRELDILALDATNPFGNGHLLPRGILRESMSSLSRANFFIVTKSDQGQENLERIMNQLKQTNQVPMAKAVHRPVNLFNLKTRETVPLSFIKKSTIVSFCSIGDPRTFEDTLSSLGAMVKQNFSFMDHYIYQKKDIAQIIDFCRHSQVRTVVTTEKDEVKLTPFINFFDGEIQLLSLKIVIDIVEGKEELHSRLLRVCKT